MVFILSNKWIHILTRGWREALNLFVILVVCAGPCRAHDIELGATNLPILVITTYGQTIPDEPKINAWLGIIDNGDGETNHPNDPCNEFYGPIGIERRGATSQGFPKKQYSFETRDDEGDDLDVSLLGLPAESDWVLHAPYSDKTLMRNVLAYRIAEALGRYAPRTIFCEVVLNGQYQGIYVLMEKIKRDSQRVDIAAASPDDLSGGYLLEKSTLNKIDESDVVVWTARTEQPFVIKYPKDECLTPAHLGWIESHLNEVEVAIYGPNSRDPELGYAAYLDVPALLDFMLVNELLSNVDAFWASTYMAKDRGGKLVLGPVWDFNIAMGNIDCVNTHQTPQGWVMATKMWAGKMLRDPDLAAKYRNRYAELRPTVFSPENLAFMVDGWWAELEQAQTRNFGQWPILGQAVWPNCFVGLSFAAELGYLKSWLRQRVQWLDTEWDIVVKQRPVINEINFCSHLDFDAGDWLEIYNPWDEDVALGGLVIRHEGEIVGEFAAGERLGPRQYLLVGQDRAAFNRVFPDVMAVYHEWEFELNSSGGTIELIDLSGAPAELVVQHIQYDNEPPWPTAPDGGGPTLELINPHLTEFGPENWRTSAGHGTPGQLNGTDYRRGNFLLELGRNSPNPFRQTTSINFFLRQDAEIRLEIFDLRGRFVATLFDGYRNRGPHSATWNGTDSHGRFTAAGLYLCRITSGASSATRKLLFVR